MRERMQLHQANASARAARADDPLGLALESFDGLGRIRRRRYFGSPARRDKGRRPATANILLSKKDQFVETVTERLLTYDGARRRALRQCAVRKIARAPPE